MSTRHSTYRNNNNNDNEESGHTQFLDLTNGEGGEQLSDPYIETPDRTEDIVLSPAEESPESTSVLNDTRSRSQCHSRSQYARKSRRSGTGTYRTMDQGRARGIFVCLANVRKGMEKGGSQGQDPDSCANQNTCPKILSETTKDRRTNGQCRNHKCRHGGVVQFQAGSKFAKEKVASQSTTTTTTFIIVIDNHADYPQVWSSFQQHHH